MRMHWGKTKVKMVLEYIGQVKYVKKSVEGEEVEEVEKLKYL